MTKAREESTSVEVDQLRAALNELTAEKESLEAGRGRLQVGSVHYICMSAHTDTHTHTRVHTHAHTHKHTQRERQTDTHTHTTAVRINAHLTTCVGSAALVAMSPHVG